MPTNSRRTTDVKRPALALATMAVAAMPTLTGGLTAHSRQQPSPVPPGAADLELTVTRFFETAAQYAETFRNLTVQDTRVVEEFDESGRVRKRRVIVADLKPSQPSGW